MFYRRTLLLATIETFGGRLKRTDCQKILFLYCQRTGKNHYDFFPYQYGAYSFVASYDKQRLQTLGMLSAEDDFVVARNSNYIAQLAPKDKDALLRLRSEIQSLRGRRLIYKTYVEYPQYVCRSKIAGDVLGPDELKRAGFTWNRDRERCLFTLGYERLTIDAYLNRLIANNVTAVVDVRNNPQSMKYGFSKKSFSQFIENAGMRYFHFPELGIPSSYRKGLSTFDTYTRLFEDYEKRILPQQRLAVERLSALLVSQRRIALTCFEADPCYCHRHKIVELLKKDPTFQTAVVNL